MFRDKCCEFGILLKTHGVKGELLLKTVFEISENYNLAETIFIEIDRLLVPFFIEEYTIASNQTIIVKITDISDKNKALKFINCKVYIKGNKKQKNKFNFSNSDLIGYTVNNQDGKKVGKIINFMDIPGNFIICVNYMNKEILIPFNEHLLIDFNKKKEQITLKIENGLMDL
ncbi:MAG: 16S rRNA processing protein RimM [Bacteroidetes bacterium GWA2_32_17]|nr:MAG: 16S rRNA processing protein RimM [Bacteroidetes bacterium GWA2_32_17]